MSQIDVTTVKNFCAHCDWAYHCWITRKHLFDVTSWHPCHNTFFKRLEKILQEHWIHEVTKLHDPATQNGFYNLSVEYILSSDLWNLSQKNRLQQLKDTMDPFANQLRNAPNKLLAHKDKTTIISGTTLGEFNPGEDEDYFKILEKFACNVHDYVVSAPFNFDHAAKDDAINVMQTYSKGLHTQ